MTEIISWPAQEFFARRSRDGAAVLSAQQAGERKYDGKLPAGFSHAGDLALIRQLTEADTADAVVAEVSVGAAADLAAVVLTGRVLSRPALLDFH